MNEDISVAAAILTAEFIRKGDVKEGDAYLLWRRLRSRMHAELGREGGSKAATSGEGQEASPLLGGAL